MFSVEEYVNGLLGISGQMNSKHYEMLKSQYFAPNRTVSAPQLAKLVGYSNFYPVNLHYGKLGRMLFEQIEVSTNRSKNLEFDWFFVLSSGSSSSKGYLWTMHPELAIALEEIGLVSNIETPLPEEITSSETLTEGAIRRITVNSYERNPDARSRCIAHYGTRCFICDFDFGLKYGEFFDGYIHVHHLRPLSDIREEYEVDPINDLRPLCPNCHAVVHRRNPPFTIDEIKKMLA